MTEGIITKLEVANAHLSSVPDLPSSRKCHYSSTESIFDRKIVLCSLRSYEILHNFDRSTNLSANGRDLTIDGLGGRIRVPPLNTVYT